MTTIDRPCTVQPTLLDLGSVLARIDVTARPQGILHRDMDRGVAQTGYCTSPIPHTAALAADLKWMKAALASPQVTCIFTSRAIVDLTEPTDLVGHTAIVLFEDPATAFYALHNSAVHADTYGFLAAGEPAVIPSSCRIHATAVVEDGCVIEDGVTVGPHSILKSGTIVGAGSTIQDHCIVGADGLFSKFSGGKRYHVDHFGGVNVGPNCVLHSGVHVSRSVNFRQVTQVAADVACGPGANLGHDCRIGPRTTVSARAMVLGRASVGADCWLGAGAIVSNDCAVGDGARVMLGSVVIRNVAAGADVSGNFARPHHQNLRELLG
jgi:UDP-3-O-[3-hydroxymyristoyl] glucosamine N-acyltransferase